MKCISIKTCLAFVLGLFIMSCTSTPERNVASDGSKEESYNQLRQRAQQAGIAKSVTSLHEGIQVAPESVSYPERMAEAVAYNLLTQAINFLEDTLDAADGVSAGLDRNQEISEEQKAAMVSIPSAVITVLVANKFVISKTPIGNFTKIDKIPATAMDRADLKAIDKDGFIDVEETSRKGTVVKRKSSQGNYKVFEVDLTSANEEVAKATTNKAATATPPPPPPPAKQVAKTDTQVKSAKKTYVQPKYGSKRSAKAAKETASKFKSTKKPTPSLILGEPVERKSIERFLEVRTETIRKQSSRLRWRGFTRNGLILAGFVASERAINYLLTEYITMTRDEAEDFLNAAKEQEQMMRQNLDIEPTVDDAL